jgi:hypothetical protein
LSKGKVGGAVISTGKGDEQEVRTGGRDRKQEQVIIKESWDSGTGISDRKSKSGKAVTTGNGNWRLERH